MPGFATNRRDLHKSEENPALRDGDIKSPLQLSAGSGGTASPGP